MKRSVWPGIKSHNLGLDKNSKCLTALTKTDSFTVSKWLPVVAKLPGICRLVVHNLGLLTFHNPSIFNSNVMALFLFLNSLEWGATVYRKWWKLCSICILIQNQILCMKEKLFLKFLSQHSVYAFN